MIRTLTLTLATAIASSALAQHTFQYANFPTTAMQMTVYVLVDPGGTDAPTNGPDQTWQYSAMTWAEGGTAWLGPAPETPYAGDYPTANNAWVMTPTGGSAEYQYSAASSTGFEIIATHVPAAPNVYSNPQQVLQFPWTIGGSFTDDYTSPDHSGTTTWTYDGYGTFITSLGTFTNQMKITSSDDELILWNESPLYPTLIVNSSSVLLFAPSADGVADVAGNIATRLYPNPCADLLTTEALPKGMWRITDMTGRTVLTGRSSGVQRQDVDVTDLLPGSYLLIPTSSRAPIRFTKG